jgi:hypothetical protein
MIENKVVIERQGKGLRMKGFPLFLSPFPCFAPALLHNFVLIFAGVYCEWQEFILALHLYRQLDYALNVSCMREHVHWLNVVDVILFC